MNLARKYKISKILNQPLNKQLMDIVDDIRFNLFLSIVHYYDKNKLTVYSFNNENKYVAKKNVYNYKYTSYVDTFDLHKSLNLLDLHNEKPIFDLLEILYQEIIKSYPDYNFNPTLKYPTLDMLSENFKRVHNAIDTYIKIMNTLK